VEVEEQQTHDIVRALVDGLADIGVFAENTPTHGLVVFPYDVNRLVLLCRRDHPLARKRSTDFASCLEYDFVASNRGSAILELLSHAAEEASRPMRLRVQVRSYDAMCRMVAAGLGVGILPLATCEALLQTLQLRAVPLRDAWATRRLVVGVHANREMAPAALGLLQHLHECAAAA
jgi:DNA-binding transcriptional LysR family regulator